MDPVTCPNRSLMRFARTTVLSECFRHPRLTELNSPLWCRYICVIIPAERNVGRPLRSGRSGFGKYQGSEIGPGYFPANEVTGQTQNRLRL